MRTIVIKRIRTRAWTGQHEVDVLEWEVLDLLDALGRTYASDACIVQYAPPEGTERFPRLAKSALARWSDGVSGPKLESLLVDIDYVNHQVPPDDWHLEVVAKVQWPCGWYRTPHGLRLVIEPHEPIPLLYADSYIAWAHSRLQAMGIATDPSCTDWTRLSKAPRILGHDLPMDLSGIAPLTERPDELTASSPVLLGDILGRSMPDGDIPKLTRAHLKGMPSKLAEDIFHARLWAPEGERHSVLLSAAIALTTVNETNDPLVPFLALHTCAIKMGKSIEELWGICRWAAALQSGASQAVDDELTTTVQDTAEVMGVKRSAVRQRVVIDAGPEFFVWDESLNQYTPGFTHQHQLAGALDRHAPILSGGGEGSFASLMRELSSHASEVRYTYCNELEGYVDGTMVRRVCRPDPALKPKFDADIEKWFLALFGAAAPTALDWLASYPRIDRPLCALYLDGPKSIGKSMLAMGLARLHSRDMMFVAYPDLAASFNDPLLKSPLVWADEKVQAGGHLNDSAVFRRVVGNGVFPMNAKYRAKSSLTGYPRILITANNADALQIREDLDNEDIEAIRIRIGYVKVERPVHGTDPTPVALLKRLAVEAGEPSAREFTEHWVAGGGIARHVLWLAENRVVQEGSRLLVEGWESDLTRDLSTSVGSAGAVAEVVALAIAGGQHVESVRWFGGQIYASNTLLAADWEVILGHRVDRAPNSNARLKALKSLSHGVQARLKVNGQAKRQLYWVIDAGTIARIAEGRGICTGDEITAAVNRPHEPSFRLMEDIEQEALG